jgi:conjugal transfer pilus assembly protein TraB
MTKQDASNQKINNQEKSNKNNQGRRIWEGLSISGKQWVIAVIIFAALGTAGLLVMKQIKSTWTSNESKKAEERVLHKGQIESIGDKVDSEAAWRYQQNEKIKKLQDGIHGIKQELTRAISTNEQENLKSKEASEVEMLKQEIASLRNLIGGVASQNREGDMGSIKPLIEKKEQNIRKIKIELGSQNKGEKVRNKEDTIPAGSFAKAVLLGGVDASTALTSSSDPRPILIRLMDRGTLPRKFQSDLKDCHIVGSGYGDLSSERVFARLEKLTCVERVSGEIIETEVAGYVTGEDGRAGIKGIVVEKGRGYLAKSVLGGVLQGLSGVFNPSQPAVINPMGAFVPKRSAGDKFNEGMMSGASGSMDRLSKYYIDRAESIQPVIQIESGRIVDVVFTEGADIGSSRVKEKLSTKRENELNKEVNNSEY